MSQSFWEIFDGARPSSQGGEAIVGRSTALADIYVGADAGGAVTVVVECEPPEHPLAAFELTGVRARFDVLLDLEIDDSTHQARCSVLQCLAPEASIQKLFLSTIESLLRDLPLPRSTRSVYEQFQAVVWMFSRLAGTPESSVTGLLGELAVLAFHPDPVAAAHAWRARNNSRFDFTFEGYRLEVKSTTTRTRSHEVSYEQVNPPAGTLAFLASVWVEEAQQGMSGADLLDVALRACAVDPAASQRLRDVVTNTMGNGLEAFLEFRCDQAVLRDEMTFYNAEDVPAFRHLPPGVSGARFMSDLSFADPVNAPAHGRAAHGERDTRAGGR